MGKVLFTVREDIKLVEVVKKYPCLYDVTTFKDQFEKDAAFKEVARYVKRSEEDCKKRWRNIKDTYKKRLRRGTSTNTSSKGKQWTLAPMLSFLDSVIYRQQSKTHYQHDLYVSSSDEETPICETIMIDEDIKPSLLLNETSISSNENINQIEDLFQQPTCPHEKRIDKVLERMEVRLDETEDIIRNFSQNQEDDVDLFFKSIAMSVKKLSPELICEAKLRSLKMISELENTIL